jgi:AcrR family transcriptional regulator
MMTIKANRPRRTKAQQRLEMLEIILDAAEYLFSRHGLHGVTLNEIAKQANTHVSLLLYYFTDKKAIFDAVFARRGAESAERRMAALDLYEQECAGTPTVEGALHAFLDSDLDLFSSGDEGWRDYGTLAAQVSMTPQWGAELFDTYFDSVVLKLIDLLKRALPGCPEQTIFWGYHFVSAGHVLSIARTGRIDTLSGGLCKSDDFAAIKVHIARFMAAGLRAICQPIETSETL